MHRRCGRRIKGSHLLSPAGMGWITLRGACPGSSTAPEPPVLSSSLPTSAGSAQGWPKPWEQKQIFNKTQKCRFWMKKNPNTKLGHSGAPTASVCRILTSQFKPEMQQNGEGKGNAGAQSSPPELAVPGVGISPKFHLPLVCLSPGCSCSPTPHQGLLEILSR